MQNKFVDHTGRKIGRITVTGYAGRNQSGVHTWHCLCICGGTTTLTSPSVAKNDGKQSCGCYNRERVAAFKFRHGAAVGDETVEYKTWCRLKNRCLNPKSQDYPYYGERGITVAPEWIDSFEAFFAEVGPRPSPKHSIDRIDNDRGYEPGNCRWATRSQQMRNSRHAAPVVASNGEYYDHVVDAMKVYGRAIYQSMAKGYRAGGLTWRRATEEEVAIRRRLIP